MAIDNLARDRTVVTVAHRLHTVKKADRILVMDKGRLIEHGNHDQLMVANGLYRALVDARGLVI